MCEGTKQLRAIAESEIVLKTIVDLLYDYRNQARSIYALFELMGAMMTYGKLAHDLCGRGVLHLIAEVMLSGDDFRNGLIRIGFEILWSAIEAVGVDCLIALASQ